MMEDGSLSHSPQQPSSRSSLLLQGRSVRLAGAGLGVQQAMERSGVLYLRFRAFCVEPMCHICEHRARYCLGFATESSVLCNVAFWGADWGSCRGIQSICEARAVLLDENLIHFRRDRRCAYRFPCLRW